MKQKAKVSIPVLRLCYFCFSVLLFASAISCRQRSNRSDGKDTLTIPAIPENETSFTSLDGKTLLSRLFDNPVIDSTGVAIWTPNYYERQNIRVSDDGKCYTNVDTIMYFTDQRKRRCAAVIFTTYRYRRGWGSDSTRLQIGDCHFCGVPIGIALLSQQHAESAWELYRFEKAFTSLGYFGEYRTGRRNADIISLKTIGDPWTCLSLWQGVGGTMGEFVGDETLYAIEEYQIGGFPAEVLGSIFSYNHHYQNGEHDDSREEFDAAIKWIKRPGDYDDFRLVTTDFRGKVTTEYYRYSEGYGHYIKR